MARASAAALAVCAALGACGAWGAGLGTLFMTPEQRARLDRLRLGEAPVAGDLQQATGKREITGYVKRSDGRGTVWIDGRPELLTNPRAGQMLDPAMVRAYSESAGEVRLDKKRAR